MPSIARQGRFEIYSTELLLSKATDFEKKFYAKHVLHGFGGEDNYFVATLLTTPRFIFRIMHYHLIQLY
jgi:hypothetical protein